MKNIKLLTLLVASALSSTAAFSSEMATEKSKADNCPSECSIFDNTYVGVELGMAQVSEPGVLGRELEDSIMGGLYAGYKVNEHLSFEVGFQFFDKFDDDNNDIAGALSNQQITMATKIGYPLLGGKLNPYFKLGAAAWMSEVEYQNFKDDENGLSVIAGVGLGYQVNDNINLKAEFQHTNDISRSDLSPYKADINHVSLGFEFHFGKKSKQLIIQEDRHVSPLFPANEDITTQKPTGEAEVVESKNLTSTEVVKPEAKQKLLMVANFASSRSEIEADIDLTAVIKSVNENPEKLLVVSGHADQTGDAEKNLELSIERAKFIAKALKDAGVDPLRIVVAGDGSAKPVITDGIYLTDDEINKENRRVEVYLAGK